MRVKKSDLSNLKVGEKFDSKFGVVTLLEAGNGRCQKFSAELESTGEVVYLRYSQLRHLPIDLTRSDLLPDENGDPCLPIGKSLPAAFSGVSDLPIDSPMPLTAPQAMYVESLRWNRPEPARQRSGWNWVDRCALAGGFVSYCYLHWMIASLFV